AALTLRTCSRSRRGALLISSHRCAMIWPPGARSRTSRRKPSPALIALRACLRARLNFSMARGGRAVGQHSEQWGGTQQSALSIQPRKIIGQWDEVVKILTVIAWWGFGANSGGISLQLGESGVQTGSGTSAAKAACLQSHTAGLKPCSTPCIPAALMTVKGLKLCSTPRGPNGMGVIQKPEPQFGPMIAHPCTQERYYPPGCIPAGGKGKRITLTLNRETSNRQIGGPMSEDTADIVGTIDANFTVKIDSATIVTAFLM